MQKVRIGDLLLQHQLITDEQLQAAIDYQKNTGKKLGSVLVELGFTTETAFNNLLAEQLNIPLIDLKHFNLNPDLVRELPESIARRLRAIILSQDSEKLTIGLVDPLDLSAYDELSAMFHQSIRLALVRESELLHSIDIIYRHSEEISGFARELSGEIETLDTDFKQFGDELGDQDAPVVKLLSSIFKDALQVRASDIHIEPDEKVLRIRQRIDGVLQEQVMEDKRIASAVTQRIKLMGGLNIAEKRIPQDGRFNILINGKKIDVRLSTLPTQYGESVVMRILDQSASALDLPVLGFTEKMIAELKELIHQPHGMVLVTGPTGSGKTTTLYSLLSELNRSETKIITVEDPVEYRLPRITQVQVNPKIELSFAKVLRAVLRQDPDVIMVGEIRDKETAQIALRAAITGHLVIATLHTNDAISSALRLVDMGGEGYMVTAGLKAILAQRLLRRVCAACARDYQPDDNERSWLQAVDKESHVWVFKQGQGCTYCNNTGYKGRIGVFELLIPNQETLNALRNNNPVDFSQAAQQQQEFCRLSDNALTLARQGITSLSEVMRISGEVYEEDKVM